MKTECCLCVADFSARELMTSDLVTVAKDERVDSVWQILQHIHHVIVTDDSKQMLGIVSHRDLMRWSAAFIGRVLPIQIPVENILQPFAKSLSEDISLRTVAIELLENKIGSMPIVNKEGQVKGIITESDFVRFLSQDPWRHPIRTGQTVEFARDNGTERQSAGVRRIRETVLGMDLLVQDCMTSTVQTLRDDESLDAVDTLMRRHHIRHVPVCDALGNMRGLISQRDYLRVAISDLSDDTVREKKIKNASDLVKHYMKSDLITVTPQTQLREAAHLMLEHRIGCLPVLEEGKLSGIISRSDFVRLFADGV